MLPERIKRLFRPRPLRYEGLAHIIIGLGNPGRRYAATRHNIGWMVLRRLAEREGLSFKPGRGAFQAARWTRGAGDALLVLPGTYMNRSGEAVLQLRELTGLGPEAALVVLDDLDLPLGRLRLRSKGGAGGHKGLDSLIAAWGDTGFARLRLGIGRSAAAGEGAVDHVLTPFAEEELDTAQKMIEAAADAVAEALDGSFERAMSRFNAFQIR